MVSTNNGERKSQLDILSLNEALNCCVGIHLIKLLVRFQWESPKTHAVDKSIGGSPQLTARSYYYPIQLIEHGDVDLVPT